VVGVNLLGLEARVAQSIALVIIRIVTDKSSLVATVSVIIPTHNRIELLKSAINSVLAQTYQDLEIIVVDDASSANIRDVVAGFRDKRIRYIRHETNRGGSAARNTGITAAQGAYIAFLDDDDEWDPVKTEAQLKLLEKYDAAMCMYSIDGAAAIQSGRGTAVTVDELRRGFVRGGSTSALMVRSHVAKDIMFDENLPKCQDWDFCIRIAQKYTIGCIDEPLVRYNDGEHDRISNIVTQLSAPEIEKRLQMLDKHKTFFGPIWYKRHMCRFLLYGVRHRPEIMKHIRYVAVRYGMSNVLRALGKRFWVILAERTKYRYKATR